MPQYILAIDQGTTSSRAIIFNHKGQIESVAQQEFEQHFPRDGWVEHEPEDIWLSVQRTCKDAIAKAKIEAKEIAAIGITNQRETTLVWNKKTGKPVSRAIVWQDRRMSSYCKQLTSQGVEKMIRKKTGLLIDPYFSATKVRWILDEIPNARKDTEKGDLAFGTVDCFLLWKLTSGKVHRTDATNASRTMLFNIHTQEWDNELLGLLDIPSQMLPEVMDCAADFGVTSKGIFGAEIPILGVAGDQQAALFGQTCFKPGMAKSTYGTGCFLVVNTGEKALSSENRLLTTIGYRLDGKTTYAIEGSIFNAGTTIQWLRDKLDLIENAAESETLAEQTPVEHGVYLVPAFTGLGAPYWDSEARGGIFGLTRDSGIKEMVTAGLQSVCYQTKDLQRAMATDGQSFDTLRVDGGMVVNNWLLQFLADILDASVERPEITETTALGAAYLAGLQAGIFSSLTDLKNLWQSDRKVEPKMDSELREALYDGWLKAVVRVQNKNVNE